MAFLALQVHDFKYQLLHLSQASAFPPALQIPVSSISTCNIPKSWSHFLQTSLSQLLSTLNLPMLGPNPWSHPQLLSLSILYSFLLWGSISDSLEICPESGHFSHLPLPSSLASACLGPYSSLLSSSLPSSPASPSVSSPHSTWSPLKCKADPVTPLLKSLMFTHFTLSKRQSLYSDSRSGPRQTLWSCILHNLHPAILAFLAIPWTSQRHPTMASGPLAPACLLFP